MLRETKMAKAPQRKTVFIWAGDPFLPILLLYWRRRVFFAVYIRPNKNNKCIKPWDQGQASGHAWWLSDTSRPKKAFFLCSSTSQARPPHYTLVVICFKLGMSNISLLKTLPSFYVFQHPSNSYPIVNLPQRHRNIRHIKAKTALTSFYVAQHPKQGLPNTHYQEFTKKRQD